MTTAEATTGITSIAEVLANLGIELTRSGGAEIVGRCPVHIKRVGKADNSPSWSMNAETGLWICFSCGAKGTLSSLIRNSLAVLKTP
jgi:DNA primase